MMDMTDWTVMVTGASSGYGEATARRFAALGARVILTGRREAPLKALAAELGDRTLPVAFDVGSKEQVHAAIDALPAPFDKVDILVNNAGLALGLEPSWKTDLTEWETMVQTNILGVLYCTRRLLPGMVERGRGHVINISSIAANYPYPGGNVYGATKAFVKQLSLNLRADLLGHPVRVTNIEPGLSKTNFSVVRFRGDESAADKAYEGVQPLSGDDIAEACIWAATLPAHVNINRIELMPTMQANGPLAVHRE